MCLLVIVYLLFEVVVQIVCPFFELFSYIIIEIQMFFICSRFEPFARGIFENNFFQCVLPFHLLIVCFENNMF